MDKKDKKTPTLPATAVPTGKAPEVKIQAFGLRDIRPGTTGGLLETSTERVWRNCQYPDRVTFDQYFRMYSRNNVAARVIETFPDYTWGAVPFVSDEAGEKSRFSKAVTQLLTMQFKLQDGVSQSLLTSMKQLDVLGGIGGEALLVFGFSDKGKIGDPVVRGRETTIEWIKLLHNGQFEIEKREEDANLPTFGDVILYRTKAFTATDDLNFSCQIAPGKSIHASRCVHFKETNGLSYGTSRIQKCYNQLLDITKLSGASAEVYWLGAFSGLAVETDPLAQLDDDAYARMKEEIAKYFDGLERSLIMEGAVAKLLYPAIVSPKDHFDLQITMISIATGIPRRFLTGAEAAKLASQQDTLNWDTRVTSRREMFAGPKVVMPVVQRCIDAGVLPKPSGGTVLVSWPRSQSLALNERADASRNMTAAWLSYFSSGMAAVVPFKVYLLYTCGYGETEAEDIERKTKSQDWKIVQKIAEAAKTAPAPTPSKSGTSGGTASNLEERVTEIEAILEDTPTPSSVAYQDLPQAKPRRRKEG